MSAPAWDVVILTEDRYLKPDPADWYQAQIQTEDGLLAQACANRGLSVSRASWSDPAFPWEKARCALFRSTWDYFARIDEFGPWLERVAARTRLYNPAALIRWNLDKRYLAELAEAAGSDAFHVSAYADPSRAIGYTEAHSTHVPGRFVAFGAAIRTTLQHVDELDADLPFFIDLELRLLGLQDSLYCYRTCGAAAWCGDLWD